MILLVAALVILGPERLPGAVRWTTQSLRRVRDYANGATAQLRQEWGPEFEELREPLTELQRLRRISPRSMVTEHLLGGDNTVLDDVNKLLADSEESLKSAGREAYYPLRADPPLARGEIPPIDPDAT